MANYPALKPAFTVEVEIDHPLTVGSASRNANLTVVPMTGGTLKSESGFSPAIDSAFVGTGNDYIHSDTDGKHLRLNAHGVVKTKDDVHIYINYTGVISVTDAEAAVFDGKASDGATPWGNIFAHFTFETSDSRYKELENGVFVAQGRFRVQQGKPTVVEYKVSQVVQG